MVEFKKTKKDKEEQLNKKNFDTEYFVTDYYHLISNPESMKNTKAMDVEYNKKTGYDVLASGDLQKINVIPGFKSGLHDLVSRVLQGIALVFISEHYEPFRIFDTEKQQEEFATKQKENDIRDSEIKDFLVKGGFYQRGRQFLDDWGHIQQIDNNMKIAERNNDGDVIHLKDKNGRSFVRKMDVELHHFSIKTLNFALDFLIKNKNQKTSAIKKNTINEKNIQL